MERASTKKYHHFWKEVIPIFWKHLFSCLNVGRNQALADQVGKSYIKNKCARKRTWRTKAGKLIPKNRT